MEYEYEWIEAYAGEMAEAMALEAMALYGEE